MKYQEAKKHCQKLATSCRRSLAKNVQVVFTHSIFLTITLTLFAPLIVPSMSFNGSLIMAFAACMALACGFGAVNQILSLLLEQRLLCTLTWTNRGQCKLAIAVAFFCFGISYAGVAVLIVLLCKVLTVFSIGGVLKVALASAILVSVEVLLNIPFRNN
jgi:hypothetical protein